MNHTSALAGKIFLKKVSLSLLLELRFQAIFSFAIVTSSMDESKVTERNHPHHTIGSESSLHKAASANLEFALDKV